jgi:hypothetical protein
MLIRYCLRFLPIEGTCYASAEEVMKMAGPLLAHHFPVCEKDKALKVRNLTCFYYEFFSGVDIDIVFHHLYGSSL